MFLFYFNKRAKMCVVITVQVYLVEQEKNNQTMTTLSRVKGSEYFLNAQYKGFLIVSD